MGTGYPWTDIGRLLLVWQLVGNAEKNGRVSALGKNESDTDTSSKCRRATFATLFRLLVVFDNK